MGCPPSRPRNHSLLFLVVCAKRRLRLTCGREWRAVPESPGISGPGLFRCRHVAQHVATAVVGRPKKVAQSRRRSALQPHPVAHQKSRARSLRHHPAARSHGHRDVEDGGAGRMRACAIACHASRWARMSSSAALRSASFSSASATRRRSSSSAFSLASRAARQGIRACNRLADGSVSTASIS